MQTCFGVTSAALDWIKSFLSDRTYFIRLNDRVSQISHIKFGVPQGSILGPLLFIFYTANITRIAEQHDIRIHSYADDTQLYIHLNMSDLQQAKDKLVSCVREVQVWCASMRLRLNPSKTELIWFYRGSRDVHPLSGCSLQLDPDCSIIPVKTVRDLGVILDGALKMNAHITSVTRSCFYHLRRIRQVKRCLNERCLRVLVQALVMSRIDYCNAVLAGLPAVALHPLTAVLHAAARIIKNIDNHDHIAPVLRQLHWLPIPARITFKLCSLMYNILSHTAPEYMTSLINSCMNQTGRRRLRSASRGDAVILRANRNYGKRAFAVAGPIAWNSLPAQIRRASTVQTFKSKLKTYLFSLYHQ